MQTARSDCTLAFLELTSKKVRMGRSRTLDKRRRVLFVVEQCLSTSPNKRTYRWGPDFQQQGQNSIVHVLTAEKWSGNFIRIKSKCDENFTILKTILFLKTRKMSDCDYLKCKIKRSVHGICKLRGSTAQSHSANRPARRWEGAYAGQTSTSIICRRAATERRGGCALLFTIGSM